MKLELKPIFPEFKGYISLKVCSLGLNSRVLLFTLGFQGLVFIWKIAQYIQVKSTGTKMPGFMYQNFPYLF